MTKVDYLRSMVTHGALEAISVLTLTGTTLGAEQVCKLKESDSDFILHSNNL